MAERQLPKLHTRVRFPSPAPSKAILPRRGWRGRLVPDAHGAKSACDNAPIDPIPIADEVVRSLIPGKGLRYLTGNPFCRRICSDVGPDEVSAAEPDDDEGIKQVETDSWNNEQVHGGNVRRVVAQEGSPSLAGRPPSFDHVLGDARLRDLKPELEQFAVDAWRAPKIAGLSVYKAIPFAAPPIGPNRWKAPQPVVAKFSVNGAEIADQVRIRHGLPKYTASSVRRPTR